MKIAKILFFGLAVLLFSCGEDEDPVPTTQGMVGKWAITAVEYKGTSTTSAQGTSIKADFSGTGKDMNLVSTFTANPNTVTTEGSYTLVVKTTMMGQTSTDEYTVDEITTDGTWSLSGNKLTITDADGSETATVVEQTATTLKLLMEINESETDQGITLTSNIKATYTFTKK